MHSMLNLLPTIAMRIGPLDFGEPLWLIALIIFIPIVYFWKTSAVPASRGRRWTALALRSVLTLAIILALAETRITWFSKGVCVIFVIDQSESVSEKVRSAQRDQIAQIVNSKMGKDDLFAIIEFAGDSVIASLPSVKGPLPASAQTTETARTDIGRALRLALATFPTDRQKRIVLISDGLQNSGDALREARYAALRDTDIETITIDQQAGNEIMIDSISAPPRSQKDSQFGVRVIIRTDKAQKAQVTVRRNGQIIYSNKALPVVPGINPIDIPDKLSDGGFYRYEVTVIPEKKEYDTENRNNFGYGYTMVQSPGKTLVVNGSVNIDYLTPALKKNFSGVETVSPAGVPSVEAELLNYDCVILNNVNAKHLDTQQRVALQNWIKDLGGGLVMIGGDDSFGPGGYKGTELEVVSPVSMDVKRTRQQGSLAIVVVYDKSGSMGAPAGGGSKLYKMDLANEGSAQVINQLDETDIAQSGSVDTAVTWATDPRLIRMTPGNKKEMMDRIRGVRTGGGGILVKTALEAAYKLINDPTVTTMTRHVILFADADDADEQETCFELARRNFAKKPAVTLSVIGLGNEHSKDWQFLKELATYGGGRSFITDNANQLPLLFAKEAFVVRRNAWVESEDGIPPRLYDSPLLEGINGSNRVYGYVATTIKPRAATAMTCKSKDDIDPLLAHWSYGLGKVVAYTSDAQTRWGKDWIRWNAFEKFWSQTVRWASRDLSASPLVTSTTIEGNIGKVRVEAITPQGDVINDLRLEATIKSENINEPPLKIRLPQTAPGLYEGTFPAKDRNIYTVGVTGGSVSAAIASYPQEYKETNPNIPLMNSLSEVSGGSPISDFAEVFTPKPNAVRSYWPLWTLLMVLCGSSLLADIAWRRLNIADYFRPKSKGTPAPMRRAGAGETVSAFKNIKSERQQVAAVEQAAHAKKRAVPPPVDPILPVTSSQPAPIQSQTSFTGEGEVKKTDKSSPPSEGGYTSALQRAKRRAAEQIKDREDRS
jgi:uncharacterized membrane protein